MVVRTPPFFRDSRKISRVNLRAHGHDGGTRKGLAGLRIRDAEEERRASRS